MKNEAKSDYTIKNYDKLLTFLADRADLGEPEQVKRFIATYQTSNGHKRNLCIAYHYYTKTHGLEWEKPKYRQEPKPVRIPTREKLEIFISNARMRAPRLKHFRGRAFRNIICRTVLISHERWMFGKSSLLVLGFLALAIAFLLSLFVGVGTLYGESYHVAIFLQDDPSYVFRAIEVVALLGILPITASLVLHAVAYVKEGYSGISSLRTILTLFIGGLAAVWGYLFCRASYLTYFIAVSSTHNEHIIGIDDCLLQIYSLYGVYGAIWLLLGTFLIGASLYSLLERK